MGRPRKGENRKSRMVTFRMEEDVYQKLKRLHPNHSEWLRDRVKYDLTRKHRRKGQT